MMMMIMTTMMMVIVVVILVSHKDISNLFFYVYFVTSYHGTCLVGSSYLINLEIISRTESDLIKKKTVLFLLMVVH